MIVCHCNVITCQDIRDAVGDMRGGDPYCIVTPGRVFKAHGCKANCGGCMPLFTSVIEEAVTLHGGIRKRARTRLIDASSVAGIATGSRKIGSASHAPAGNDDASHSASQGDSHEGQQGRYRSA
ncbi:MAG: hypothetical protein V2I51_15820 [Anderseniella sp.]|jgi:bacterioferritin-associated ferredoxin|nr:hypothetical protein [Anderseniella sp.]